MKKKLPKIIAVDFDGTLCENAWPDIGAPNEKLISDLKWMQKTGVKLILWTCRHGLNLRKALRWCKEQGLIFDAVNRNLPEVIKYFGSDTRKIFAYEYIDDKNNNRYYRLPFRKDDELEIKVKLAPPTEEVIQAQLKMYEAVMGKKFKLN